MVQVRELISEEEDPVTWDRDVWEDPIEVVAFEPSDSKVFISHEEVVSSLSPNDVSQIPHHSGITPSLSVRPAITSP